ncbi:phosphoribosylformylglycinamidine synthase II [candidate division WOR-1 bacterium RIFCSPHIGHO2_01_FULL_53_15]|uniref:Phosphoribosylformylglycinamidine synthase subunit PurL n=1 Tax=candidate division WOR-1 bacterium RIFCSPHIGHO2_01_FULL_53_15 TaxID=1802564 RepID=A0A1F4Q0J1_UNCSA|nr:MAG: phosphoribosylformylglycinamidine synthase II [candidate division WOR-1 bacterium RIFCSPHIGHO2_01_FULL_53_15]OGC12616.1 MAG: phosphoribosylformylglycinamidine synthase II [candidate division WOR-1 bacterium RIFCSPHIGHO2_02_FULL_53_26]
MDKKVYRELGLTDPEYQRILNILKREPTPTELAMFSVEWSEHCGYPRSRKWLKLFPQTGKYEALVGEDAGGFVYDGMAIIFKMESHNHPSQVEPKQGAATGVGGIIRDIFTSGARPIALFDSLRFGQLNNSFNKYIFSGVIDGIQSYGNCVGVPTVGGEIYFDDAYAGNCLVNVMCIGIAPKEKIARARAAGLGNPIIYAGAKTGRDGIGGCSVLASSEFEAEECEKRPTVQVGDPFTEKCLIEATLEALETGVVVGLKDMGAAGLTCSSSEMAAAGGVGIDLDLDKVPLREEGMEPWEIMMSESQERMLLCVEAGKEDKVLRIFHKWGLDAAVVGRVIKEEKMIIKSKGKIIAEAPTEGLAKAPIYDMAFRKSKLQTSKSKAIRGKNPNDQLLNLLSDPNIASKRSVYEQYDHMVQTNTIVYPGGDAAVLRVKGKPWGIAATTDCNGRYCQLDPYSGAQIAVAEAARNLVVTGAEPAAVTDCLNFGNPEKPERFYQFKLCVEGIVDACKFFELPVISGNVSFYNESPRGPILPTPTIGMVGIIKDIDKRCSAPYKDKGDLVVLLGHNREENGAPELDLDVENRVQKTCLEAIQSGIVKSAHDLSEGGLAVALAECSIISDRGSVINLSDKLKESDLLFGEAQSRILLTIAPENIFSLSDFAMLYQVPCAIIGKVGGKSLSIMRGKKKLINLPVARLKDIYFNALPNLLKRK